ncbi:hypothetical protein [Accumulibacter sp.]|uniref:hypothetical protein n=1 Tax=Accumulibacter sp. TaxID=2053492 RepID=UPI001A3EF26F|nr:hypothetical protein [Accumulibacter sp.]MBL8373791.1 hypothetical protein [Accumulibacter sp.]
MIPIQSICPDCYNRLAQGLAQLESGTGKTLLFGYCEHHQVLASVTVAPGGIAAGWLLSPYATAAEAKAGAESFLADAESLRQLAAVSLALAQTGAPQ